MLRWFLAVMTATAVAHAQEARIQAETYRLDNGLEVLLHQDSSVPMVVIQLWYRTGSKDEGGGPKGLAHLFEHMMFKGTHRYPDREYDKIIESSGGRNNAFTSRDVTGYHIAVPREHLEKMLELEADRMVGLAMQKPSLESELEVVKEERRMRTDNSPMGAAYEKVTELLYEGSPYEWPPIGSMKDINSITFDHADAFYRRYYAPNNAVLSIVGDFEPARVRRWIERYFGELKVSQIADFQWQEPKKNRGPRVARLIKKVDAPLFMLAYQSFAEQDPDNPALEALADILGKGTSSRLHQKLVYEKKWATGVQIFPMSEKYSGGFLIMVNMKDASRTRAAQDLIRAELHRLKTQFVSASELEKVKVGMEKAVIDGLKTFMGRSQVLAHYQTMYGDYRKIYEHIAAFDRLQVQDLQRVAKRVFDRRGEVLVEVVSK